MRKLLLILMLLVSVSSYAQSNLTKIPQNGVAVVEFNASWNSTTPKVTWLGKLTDCTKGQLLIDKYTKFQTKYKIVVVPTIIVFKDGVEHSRHQADIMMKMIHNQEELQQAIDDAHMDGF